MCDHPVFCECLADQDTEVRVSAASALWSLGTEAKPAIAALERCLADPEQVVRHVAAIALKKIEPGRVAVLQSMP